jgi:benzil reductase ((S)-benzoin forming)
MSTNLYILTGASRGLGYAMAHRLIEPYNELLCISRRSSEALAVQALSAGSVLTQWSADLYDANEVAGALAAWLKAKNPGDFSSITLINNAATLPAIAPLREASSDDIARTLRVGLESAMQLTALVLASTAQWPGKRKVLNVSSSLGRLSMASQSIYGAAKAGMDHFTRCVSEEEALVTNGAKLCSLAPGIIDTDMQTKLRETDPAKVPVHGLFVDFKQEGRLLTPEAAAARVLDYLARSDFGDKAVASVVDD